MFTRIKLWAILGYIEVLWALPDWFFPAWCCDRAYDLSSKLHREGFYKKVKS